MVYIKSNLLVYNIIYYPPHVIKTSWRLVLSSIIISILIGLIPINTEFSIQRTFTFLPFYFTGMELRRINKVNIRFMNPKIAVIICVMSALMIFISPINLIAYFYGFFNLFVLSNHILTSIVIKIMYYILAFLLCCSIGSLIPDKKKYPLLSTIGRKTLFLYLYHGIIIALCVRVFKQYNVTIYSYSSIYLFLLLMILLYLLDKIKILKVLVDRKAYLRMIQMVSNKLWK